MRLLALESGEETLSGDTVKRVTQYLTRAEELQTAMKQPVALKSKQEQVSFTKWEVLSLFFEMLDRVRAMMLEAVEEDESSQEKEEALK